MAEPSNFIVQDTEDRLIRPEEEVTIMRVFPRYKMLWKMSYKELVELQTTIATYIAGERLG